MKRAIITALAFYLFSLGGAFAEPTATESRIRELAAKFPDHSIVFMDVNILQEGKDPVCTQNTVSVISDEGYQTSFMTRQPAGFASLNRGGIGFLPPGTYTIVGVACKYTARLNGKFARFRVGKNEIINAGCLVIDFTKGPMTFFAARTFSGRTSVQDLEAKTVESLTERTPTIFPRATKRYMASNPATTKRAR